MTIKTYNGAVKQYASWNSSKGKWEFFPGASKSGLSGVRYVERVILEIED